MINVNETSSFISLHVKGIGSFKGGRIFKIIEFASYFELSRIDYESDKVAISGN